MTIDCDHDWQAVPDIEERITGVFARHCDKCGVTQLKSRQSGERSEPDHWVLLERQETTPGPEFQHGIPTGGSPYPDRPAGT